MSDYSPEVQAAADAVVDESRPYGLWPVSRGDAPGGGIEEHDDAIATLIATVAREARIEEIQTTIRHQQTAFKHVVGCTCLGCNALRGRLAEAEGGTK